MHLPLCHDAVVLVAGRAVLTLVSGPSVENLLRLLEMRRLTLHVETSEGNLRLSRVINVVLLRAHVQKYLFGFLVRETSRTSSVIARQL